MESKNARQRSASYSHLALVGVHRERPTLFICSFPPISLHHPMNPMITSGLQGQPFLTPLRTTLRLTVY